MSDLPLKDLLVLDMSRVLAGPWVGQTLADLGARVIKIEKPVDGDDTRAWGPPFLDLKEEGKRHSAYYLSANRGKESVAINIKTPEGQAIIKEIALKADILLENYKKGGLEKYGLDYASLKALNPRLIYCSITGFGQTGPDSDQAGYDFLTQGMSGLMSVTGQPDGMAGAEPMKVGVAVSDLYTGLYSVIGILGAVIERAQSGLGQQIDMALLDSQVAVLSNQVMNYLVSGVSPKRLGNSHPNIVPYQVFETSDGHVIVAVGNDGQFAKFCEILGHSEWAEDGRFAHNDHRVANRDVLCPMIAEIMKTKTIKEWMGLLDAQKIPCGPINTMEQMFAEPQVQARGLRLEIEDNDGTKIPSIANPIRYSRTPIEYKIAPPQLGENTVSVLSELLGKDDTEIKRLKDASVIDF